MKKETKELIKWLKDHLSHYRNELALGRIKIGLPAGEKEVEKVFAAINFLESLPEIESHLCRGGYIQDKNGTPCCDGDEILINGEFEAVLKWIVHAENNPDKMPHFGFQWKCDINNIDELPSFWIKKV